MQKRDANSVTADVAIRNSKHGLNRIKSGEQLTSFKEKNFRELYNIDITLEARLINIQVNIELMHTAIARTIVEFRTDL